MTHKSPRTDIFRGAERRIEWAILAVIILKIALLFVFAWHIRIVMDEFGQLGYAKLFGNGLFDTIQPPKAVGFAVFYKLAHLVGWDAPSIVLAGRLQTALLACATTALVYACARTLGEDRLRAMFIVLILLCFSNYSEQIFKVRSEQLAVFFALAALLTVLQGRSANARRIILAGVLSGLAFVTTQKSAYFNVALGLGLVLDAVLARRLAEGVLRGAYLVVGWLAVLAAYCLIFGPHDPLAVARGLVLGPVEVASRGGTEYGGLRHYVIRTLAQNSILYAFCFGGMTVALTQILSLGEKQRITLIYSVVIAALVFAHDQPWPYVFVMALPFMVLWSLTMLDRLATYGAATRVARAIIVFAIAFSLFKAAVFLRSDNTDQLRLVARAEALLSPSERYFDGIGMLPNRLEPSTLWLDRHFVLETLRQGTQSEAYRVFREAPPKVVLWSYRMDNIYPIVSGLLDRSYVQVAPNIRLAGRHLRADKGEDFKVPVGGAYGLYSETGEPIQGRVEVDGVLKSPPFVMAVGRHVVKLDDGPATALLVPVGSYTGVFAPGPDNKLLFATVNN